MNNILLIIQREYLTRVRKKSFVVMTILGPVLIALLYAGIIWAAISSIDQKTISIVDDSGLFKDKFSNTKNYTFLFENKNLDSLKNDLKKSGSDALVYIPATIFENPKSLKIYSEKGVSIEVQSKIESIIEHEIENIKLTEAGITRSTLENARVKVSAETISLKEGGEKKSSATAASVIGGIAGFLIYMAVFIYGAQVMRSITEEKTSRIVEVLISSVKPFQLMIGKIVGVALVGLTQFGLWIVLSALIFTAGGKILASKMQPVTDAQVVSVSPEAAAALEQSTQSEILPDIFGAVSTLPLGTIIFSFIIYFIGGYLLYSSLFGAVGSAVDSETDTQQFMMPITIPIIASIAIAQIVIRDPYSPLAFWASMVPLTSPIIMMVRIPFGVPIWQIALSMSLLVAGFIFTTWLAARIYRVGILMYGKKVSWKELGKWIFYKG